MRAAAAPGMAMVCLVLLFLGLHVPGCAASGATCPDWLRQAAAVPLSDAQKAAPAVVLHDERLATVSASGEVRTRRLYAAKVFTVEGREAAGLRELYLTDSDRIREMRGWVLRPSGELRELGKEDVLDFALVGNDLYNEVRARRIGLGPAPEAGVVFGAEVVSESRSVFSQFDWVLQEEWPVVRVVRTLTLPPGWRATSATFNHAPVAPALGDGSWTWEVRDLPRIADEPASPPWTSLAPRLAVGFEPPAPQAGDRPAFPDWPAVSRWLASAADPAAAPDATVRARAQALAGGATSPLDRLRALAAFVQRTQYVSIQIGVGRGGGYRPRPAPEVLAKGHGDCKDKATLLRALLSAVGQPAFLVSVFAGDPGYVRDSWPSPHQFNHVIVGIPVDAREGLPATVEVPGLGSMLMFDPTDPFTPVGELPTADQGSLALVVSAEGGPLVRLPVSGPEANGTERAIEGTIDEAGRLTATLRDRLSGRGAVTAREQYRGLSPEAYRKTMTDRLAREVPRVAVDGIEAEDAERSFGFKASLDAPAYGQVIQNRLMVVRCPTPLAGSLPSLPAAARRTPVVLGPSRSTETFILTPAPGLKVDELPPDASADTPYGSYRLRTRREGERVIVDREITTRHVMVPVADYPAVRAFVEGARAVDAATVVFTRAQERVRSIAPTTAR